MEIEKETRPVKLKWNYVNKTVNPNDELTDDEKLLSRSIFSMQGNITMPKHATRKRTMEASRNSNTNTPDAIPFELNETILEELHNNAFFGYPTDEDVVEHIIKVLEILDLLHIPDNECHGIINTWDDVVRKFFHRFYPDSRVGITRAELLKEADFHEFSNWLNEKFMDSAIFDSATFKTVWDTWSKMAEDDELNFSRFSRATSDDDEPTKAGNDEFFKPYLDTQEKVNEPTQVMGHIGRADDINLVGTSHDTILNTLEQNNKTHEPVT
ncbi:hypothetical protein Tco_0200830 [Tanacetum coccineum]